MKIYFIVLAVSACLLLLLYTAFRFGYKEGFKDGFNKSCNFAEILRRKK